MILSEKSATFWDHALAQPSSLMRIKSWIWVTAHLRRCQAENVPVVIVRRGDEDAGAIFISVNRLDGTVRLYGPAPTGLEGSETDRRWGRCFGGQPVSPREGG